MLTLLSSSLKVVSSILAPLTSEPDQSDASAHSHKVIEALLSGKGNAGGPRAVWEHGQCLDLGASHGSAHPLYDQMWFSSIKLGRLHAE